MKLHNRSLIYLSLAFLFIIGIWSVVFYINLKDEIRDSIDDGLENSRLLILQKVKTDTTLLLQNQFGGNNFEIHPISKKKAHKFKDIYKDTLMHRANDEDLEPVRMLHSAFEHQDNYYQMNIISSLIEEDDLIEDSFWSLFWLFIILVASVIIVNNVVLRKVWTPFYDILNRLKTFRLDKEEGVIRTATKTTEFLQLQEASNALIRHSKEAYDSQKQFTENASHELQTPIAIITNKLELLLESENLQEKEANTIAEVINMADRLKRLNTSLLLLAKIENKQFIEQEKVSINQITNSLLENYRELADFKHIEIDVVERNDLGVDMNASLAETLISNLVANAIFHNKKNGRISIQITDKEFSISNTGPAAALNPQTIFHRFVKDQTNRNSTGLGLAICMAICKSYEITLDYSFKAKEHSFTIDFKNNIQSV